MKNKVRVAIGVGTVVGVGAGIVTKVMVDKRKKKVAMQGKGNRAYINQKSCIKQKEQKDIALDLGNREFRCIRDARYYDKIVDKFNGNNSLATLWMVNNYDYPYNYSQIYDDILSERINIR